MDFIKAVGLGVVVMLFSVGMATWLVWCGEGMVRHFYWYHIILFVIILVVTGYTVLYSIRRD